MIRKMFRIFKRDSISGERGYDRVPGQTEEEHLVDDTTGYEN